MTRKEQNEIFYDKIKANNTQYNLDSMNAEISAYSSGDLSKYEYLTKKDLGYKPDAIEKLKFEYSPLGKVFTDGLNKSDKKEGLLKRLKNIENKNNNQLIIKELLILHGLMIQNCLIKLTMMLLIYIVKTKIQLNYYLFKTF